MKTFVWKRLGIVLGLAIALSLAIIRTSWIDNVSFCHYAAGCQDQQPHGRITTRTYGYPLAYHKVEIFNPKNSDETKPGYAGYAEVSVTRLVFSWPGLIMNVVFWAALLWVLSGFIRPRQHQQGLPTKSDTKPVAPKPEHSGALTDKS